MIKVIPLNAAAGFIPDSLTRSQAGLVLAEGFSATRKPGFLSLPRRVKAGDIIAPRGKERLIISASSRQTSKEEIRAAARSPKEITDIAVFEIAPKSGKTMFFLSQVALAVAISYLIGGIMIGAIIPTAVRYPALAWGASEIAAQGPKRRKELKAIIEKFEVLRENVVDQRSKDFFDAIYPKKTVQEQKQ